MAEGRDGVVLAWKIGGVPAEEGEAGCLGVHALAVLAHDGFEGHAAIDVDLAAGVCHHGAREATLGGEAECVAMLRSHLARVP